MGKRRMRKRYEAAFKVRVALAALKGDKTLSELAPSHAGSLQDFRTLDFGNQPPPALLGFVLSQVGAVSEVLSCSAQHAADRAAMPAQGLGNRGLRLQAAVKFCY